MLLRTAQKALTAFKRGTKIISKRTKLPENTNIINSQTAGENQSAISAIQKADSISPDDVHIKQLGQNADNSTNIFQVQFKSANNKEIKFELEIPFETLKDKASGISEIDSVRGNSSLRSDIQKVISEMSEESFQVGGKITFDELQLMASKQYRDRAFKKAVQDYHRHRNFKLSSIGVENIHIKKIEKPDSEKTFQKG